MQTVVAHPEFGIGVIEELSDTLKQCDDGDVLAFVRWTEPRTSIAGGWYDLSDERIEVVGMRFLPPVSAVGRMV